MQQLCGRLWMAVRTVCLRDLCVLVFWMDEWREDMAKGVHHWLCVTGALVVRK